MDCDDITLFSVWKKKTVSKQDCWKIVADIRVLYKVGRYWGCFLLASVATFQS